jgi:hypothetical protein
MEEKTAAFPQRLDDALAARAAWLSGVQVPALQQGMRSYRSLFESIIDALVKKGLLREDPYEYERAPDVLSPPPDASMQDTEEAAQMSTRLTAYRRRLEYIAVTLPLDLPTLTLARLTKLMAFFSYIDWAAFKDSSRSPTTRVLARLVTQTSVGADPLAARVMQESRDHIKKVIQEIYGRLDLVTAWQRESWKARARTRIVLTDATAGFRSPAERAAEMEAIKAACMSGQPSLGWHPELVLEILAEERGDEAAAKREKLLASLALPSADAPLGAGAPKPEEAMREAARGLAKVPADLRSAEAILIQNEAALRSHARGLFQIIRDWFRRAFGTIDDRSYVIETRDSPESPPEKETVIFLRFIARMREIGDLLGPLGAEGSPASLRLRDMGTDQLRDFLDLQTRELRLVHRLMDGLNTLFQVRAVQEGVAAARSIKMELLAIENAVVRTDTARKESIMAAVSSVGVAEDPQLDRLA